MTIQETQEMRKLWEIFEPWLDGIVLKQNAPKEVIKAKNMWSLLWDKQEELERKLNYGCIQ